MLKGQQVEIMTPETNRKRFLAGSVNLRTGQLVWVEAERKNSELFVAWLEAIAAAHPDTKATHVVLDNYGIHQSKRTKAALAGLGDRIRLHFLPPDNPQCNWMEQVWLHLHATVTRNHQCRTLSDLMGRVHALHASGQSLPWLAPRYRSLGVVMPSITQEFFRGALQKAAGDSWSGGRLECLVACRFNGLTAMRKAGFLVVATPPQKEPAMTTIPSTAPASQPTRLCKSLAPPWGRSPMACSKDAPPPRSSAPPTA